MKGTMLVALFCLIAGVAVGQHKKGYDPSYSQRNYKHSNKVSVAKKKNLEEVVRLEPVLVQGGPEYKHRYNQSFLVLKAGMNTKNLSKSRRSDKHPLGR